MSQTKFKIGPYQCAYESGFEMRLPLIESEKWCSCEDRRPSRLLPAPYEHPPNRDVSNFLVCRHPDVPFAWVSWYEVDSVHGEMGFGVLDDSEIGMFEPTEWMYLAQYVGESKRFSARPKPSTMKTFLKDAELDRETIIDLIQKLDHSEAGALGRIAGDLLRIIAADRGIDLDE